MALFHSPRIITNGLVLALDGASSKSFRGPAQTNIIPSIAAAYSNQDGAFFKIANGIESVNIPTVGMRSARYVDIYNDYIGGSGICCPSPFTFGSFSSGVSGNTTYTYSILYKSETGYTHPNYMYRYEYNGGTYVTEAGVHNTSNRTHLGDGWYHAWGTFITQPTTNVLTCYLFHYEYATYNRIYVAAAQITQGTYIGAPQHMLAPGQVRGATVATGGGWSDLSISSQLTAVEVLVVAGGGGGGSDMGGGGGGGGVVYHSSYPITPGAAITATVGNGGAGAPAGTGGHATIKGANGGNSIFGDITAIGGGAGGTSYYTFGNSFGNSGGSGGGGSGYNNGVTPALSTGTGYGAAGAGTLGQGFRGGWGNSSYYSGGGGGAGGAGADANNQANGGIGVLNAILGVSYYWGGGGGGAAYSLSAGGNGGAGGGGGGAVGTTTGGSGLNNGSPGGGGSPNSQTNTPGGNGGANTGGGGGGGSHYNFTNKGGDGGSGIVIVKYPGLQKATGGTITSVAGHTIHTFTAPGTFTPFGGTLVNGVGFNSANGGALVFDGIDDFILTDEITTYGSETTWEAWVYCTANVNTYNMFMGRYLPYFGFYNGNSLYFSNNIGGSQRTIQTATNLSLNTWYHTTFTTAYDGTNTTMKIYTNGVETATGTWAGIQSNYSYKFMIGDGNNGVNSSWYPFQGRISNVKVYNKNLTSQEILQNFNTTRSRFGV
jgi:hypothetical protein